MPDTYADTGEIRAANDAAGQYFFEPATMRFFGSRVGRAVYGGRFFLTSEQREHDTPRRYSIRMAMPDGSIESISAFMAYPSREHALGRLRAMLRIMDAAPSSPARRDEIQRIRAAAARDELDAHEDDAYLMVALVHEIEQRNDEVPGSFRARLALSRALDAVRDATGAGPGTW